MSSKRHKPNASKVLLFYDRVTKMAQNTQCTLPLRIYECVSFFQDLS